MLIKLKGEKKNKGKRSKLCGDSRKTICFVKNTLYFNSVIKNMSIYWWNAAKSLQSCPTLCDPRDDSPPGSPVPGILQARTLEWVAISSPNAWKWKVKVKSLSRVRLLATLWTAAYQAPPSMGFSRQAYWRGVPLPSPLMKYFKRKKIYKMFLVEIFRSRENC